ILEATGGRPGPGIGRTAREDSPGTVFRALESLTLRELEVLELLALRLSYKEIGEELFISMHTVKSHAVSIYHKLDVENRRQSLARAKSLGWTPQATPR
ncbi:MAG: helix-turn-helix transcriptional regulator, partial [Thermomicrobiales bacterium]